MQWYMVHLPETDVAISIYVNASTSKSFFIDWNQRMVGISATYGYTSGSATSTLGWRGDALVASGVSKNEYFLSIWCSLGWILLVICLPWMTCSLGFSNHCCSFLFDFRMIFPRLFYTYSTVFQACCRFPSYLQYMVSLSLLWVPHYFITYVSIPLCSFLPPGVLSSVLSRFL